MKSYLPKINPWEETEKIVSFLTRTFKKQRFSKAVIGISGGIDSTTCLYLLRKALKPENIFPVHLPYFLVQRTIGPWPKRSTSNIKQIFNKLCIPSENQYSLSIKKPVDELKKVLAMNYEPRTMNQIRLGNIMARIRMIILFDLAKKNNALVCGTENKSEHLLGYFTRFGDAASDIEPIAHLYKTQIYQLANYLKVPKEIVESKPTAGLWRSQTDEGQFGFTYEEADQVLYLHFDKKKRPEEILKLGLKNAKKILQLVETNRYKQYVPYSL